MKSKAGWGAWVVLSAVMCAGQYHMALPGYRYEFPRDHFNHPEFQTEWWYYTGNLKAANGHRFGFELTFFRQGVERAGGTGSAWSVQDLYFAHLALSVLDGGEFYHTERFNRAGPGLAGASLEQMRVWNGNWQVKWEGKRQRLGAIEDRFAIQLAMDPAKPPVVHGENGVSQKASGEGHASHYISFTRLLSSGTIELSGKTFEVTGSAWMDHEFFTKALGANEAGWDWLSMQLDDQSEVMLYRLRNKDGSAAPYSSGTYVDRDGKATHLKAGDFLLAAQGEVWRSPWSGVTYPVAWNVTIPTLGLELSVRTSLTSQEITGKSKKSPSYWEGAVAISGRRSGRAMAGLGYLEMTGYDRPLPLNGNMPWRNWRRRPVVGEAGTSSSIPQTRRARSGSSMPTAAARRRSRRTCGKKPRSHQPPLARLSFSEPGHREQHAYGSLT
jgi:predicted secreted hydrolase